MDIALLRLLEGKKIDTITAGGDTKLYDVTIRFTDGSSLFVEADGAEGSHLSAEVSAKFCRRV